MDKRGKYSPTWWQRPTAQAQVDRAFFYNALDRAENYNLETRLGRKAATGDFLGVLNDLASIKMTYESVNKGIERQAILNNLRDQLAPNQEVQVLIDSESNTVRSIDRPGTSYLRLPKYNALMLFPLVDKLMLFPLVGEDDGVCKGDVIPETTRFTLLDREGKKSLDLFGHDTRYKRREVEPDSIDDESSGRERRRWKHEETD